MGSLVCAWILLGIENIAPISKVLKVADNKGCGTVRKTKGKRKVNFLTLDKPSLRTEILDRLSGNLPFLIKKEDTKLIKQLRKIYNWLIIKFLSIVSSLIRSCYSYYSKYYAIDIHS